MTAADITPLSPEEQIAQLQARVAELTHHLRQVCAPSKEVPLGAIILARRALGNAGSGGVTAKGDVSEAEWIERVSVALGIYYDYDGPFVAAPSDEVVEHIKALKAKASQNPLDTDPFSLYK